MFWRRKSKVEIPTDPEAPPVLLTNAELERGLPFLRNGIHSLKRMAGDSWIAIPSVKCPVAFAGYGFVEGQKFGMRVNEHIVVCKGDDDYDYTSVCVLIDGLPSLILLSRSGHLRVTIIAGQDYFQEVFNPSGKYCDTLEDYMAFPDAIQKIIHDIVAHVLMIDGQRPDAIEAILNYGTK